MSNKKNDDHTDVFTMLFAFVLAGILLIAAFLSNWLSKLMMSPLKAPATRVFRLVPLSAHFHQMKWFYKALRILFGFIFSMILVSVLADGYRFLHGGMIRTPPDHTPIAVAVTVLLVFLCSTFVLAAVGWIEEYALDPAVQKSLAGANAEKFVQKIIAANMQHYSDRRAFHNALFVFNKDTADEFSVEADHVLITRRNIFLIETKYKSGTIFADADTPMWRTSSPHGDGSMRNALLQVKNTARILAREFSLADRIIPIVAIHGNNVAIVQGPGNVVTTHDLMLAIQAFEKHGDKNLPLQPDDIAEKFLRQCVMDSASFKKHINRIREKTDQMQFADIVKNSSIE